MRCTDDCHYGPAPHTCFYKIPGATIGQSRELPQDQWPQTFEPDEEVPGLGVHHACGWVRISDASSHVRSAIAQIDVDQMAMDRLNLSRDKSMIDLGSNLVLAGAAAKMNASKPTAPATSEKTGMGLTKALVALGLAVSLSACAEKMCIKEGPVEVTDYTTILLPIWTGSSATFIPQLVPTGSHTEQGCVEWTGMHEEH